MRRTSSLFPELLAMIFGYLDVRDKGRGVCTAWRDAAYHKSVWRGWRPSCTRVPGRLSLFPACRPGASAGVQIPEPAPQPPAT